MKFNKYKSGFSLVQILVICAFIGLLGALSVRAQVYPTSLVPLTNFPATLGAATNSVTTNLASIPVNGGLSLQGTFNVSAGTSNVVVQGSFSNDGTNYATTGPAAWTWVITANGTTKVTASTNWSAAVLAGYASVNVTTFTNQNSGTLTNNGFQFNRSNYRN